MFSNGFVLFGQVLTTRSAIVLPASEQAKLQAELSIASQLGRAFGPLMSAWIFDTAQSEFGGPGSGANFSRIWIMIAGVPPLAIAYFCYNRECFGSIDDPSPFEQKHGRQDSFMSTFDPNFDKKFKNKKPPRKKRGSNSKSLV